MKDEISVYFFLPPFAYPILERRLELLSKKGWHLVYNNAIKYTFSRGTPQKKFYFIFHSSGVQRSEGKFNLRLRHWDIIGCYGVPAKKSPLNKHASRHFPEPTIIEVRPEKVRSEAYNELRDDRRKLYLAETLYHSSLFLLCSFLLFWVSKGKIMRVFLLAVCITILLYMVISVAFAAVDRYKYR